MMHSSPDSTASGDNSMTLDYLEWNRALGDDFFRRDQGSEQVYLELDPSRTTRLAAVLEVEDVRAALVRSVSERTYRSRLDRKLTFAWFDEMLERWKHNPKRHADEPPPVIGLLVVFALAAERMSGGSGLHSEAAYYPRLIELLGLPDDQNERVQSSFRRSVESYRDAVTDWLDAQEGDRGELSNLPTIDMRYVGIPISQVLLRRTEREDLQNMFASEMLQPGATVDEIQLELMIDGWVRHERASNRLARLWRDTGLRDAIVAISANELRGWDGTPAGGQGGNERANELRLVSWQSSRGIRRAVKFGLYRDSESKPGTLWEVTVGPRTQRVDTVEISPGSIGIRLDQLPVGIEEFLESSVAVVDETGARFVRVPAPVVIFEFDERTERFLEADSTNYDSTYQLLVRTGIERLRDNVTTFLDAVAEPATCTSLGLADTWSMYTPIRFRATAHIVDPSSIHVDLLRAVPRSPRRITIAEGVRIPGRSQQYSVLSPPKLLVGTTQYPLLLDVELPATAVPAEQSAIRARAEEPLDLGAVVESITGLRNGSIPEGDYRIRLLLQEGPETGPSQVLETRTLRLRSSDTEAQEEGTGLLVHTGTPSDALRAVPFETAKGYAVAGSKSRAPATHKVGFPALSPQWRFQRYDDRSTREEQRFVSASEFECLRTGIHRIDVTDDGDRFQLQKYTCCGRQKRTPIYTRRKEPEVGGGTPLGNLAAAAAALKPREKQRNAAVIDAAVAARAGTVSGLEKLLSHIETGESTPFRRMLDLYALGTVEIGFDYRWKASGWSIAPAGLCSTPSGSVLMTGGWKRSIAEEIAGIVDDEGGSIFHPVDPSSGVPVINGVELDTLLEYEDSISTLFVSKRGGPAMLAGLPTVSEVVEDLPRHELVHRTSWSLFITRECTWTQETVLPNRPGLYRRSHFGSYEYILRTPADIADGTGRRTTVEFGKHAAASLWGRPLHFYDSSHGRVGVPLGARLPGLFERALVLCSGNVPTSDASDPTTLYYSDIPHSLAEHLAGRIGNDS